MLQARTGRAGCQERRSRSCGGDGGRGEGTLTGSTKVLGDENTVKEGAYGPANEAHGEGIGVLTIRPKLPEAESGWPRCVERRRGATNLAIQHDLISSYAIVDVMAESAEGDLKDGSDGR